MASLLLLCVALIHTSQSLPAARGGGRGLDVLLPYEDQMMSYPAQGGGGADDLYYQSGGWRGRGLDQALQQLVERDQRREQEAEQRAAYLAAVLRLLREAEGAGEVEVVEEEEEEDGRGPAAAADYDDTGRGRSVGGPPGAWWGLLEPRLAQALLDRVEPQVAKALLERQERLHQARLHRGEQQALRRLVARLLSSIGPNDAQVMSSGRRARRDLSVMAAEPFGSAPRRTRRSLDDVAPPSPSNAPPLLRVKRLEEELRPPAAGLQRMKRIDAMETAPMEELHHGSSSRRRRAALTYDPQTLIDHFLEYMRE